MKIRVRLRANTPNSRLHMYNYWPCQCGTPHVWLACILTRRYMIDEVCVTVFVCVFCMRVMFMYFLYYTCRQKFGWHWEYCLRVTYCVGLQLRSKLFAKVIHDLQYTRGAYYTLNFNHFQNILEKENGNSIIEIKLKLTPPLIFWRAKLSF